MSEKKHEGHKNDAHKGDAHKHVYMEHEAHAKTKSYETATWILAGVSVLLLIGLIVSIFMGGGASGGISESEAKAKTEAYLKSIADGDARVDSITDAGSLYNVKVTVGGTQYDSYVSKDGKLLFPQGIDMSGEVAAGSTNTGSTNTNTNIPKTDKPTIELFVMSHCPFGTQAEKGILPAIRTLGDNVDFKVRFVYYAMHGEKEIKEQLVQHCIQKNQPDVYLKYLACFLNDSAGQGSVDASNKCIASTGVDTAKLESCKIAADKEFNVMANFQDQSSWLSGRFPKFDTDLAENTKYDIGGSPTLVINGVQSNAGRDSASYLSAICNAFNEKPEECNTVLSATQPGPGFGFDSVGSAQAAGCGV